MIKLHHVCVSHCALTCLALSSMQEHCRTLLLTDARTYDMKSIYLRTNEAKYRIIRRIIKHVCLPCAVLQRCDLDPDLWSIIADEIHTTPIPVENHLTYLVWGKFTGWQEPKSPCYVPSKPLVRGSLIG